MTARADSKILLLHRKIQVREKPHFGSTAWKVSKYGVFSGSDFPVFGLNTEIYCVNRRIQSEYRKIRTRKKSVFGHFSSSAYFTQCQVIRETFYIFLYLSLNKIFNQKTLKKSKLIDNQIFLNFNIHLIYATLNSRNACSLASVLV